MLDERHLVALLLRIAVAASLASVLMRFRRIQDLILRDDRTVLQRLQLALVFSLIFGAGAEARILSHNQYQAIDLAFEASIIAGMLGGYVSGLVTGILVSLPAMFAFPNEFMSMPLYSAGGVLGGLMRDLAPEKEDVWSFSPFVDLNLYRLIKHLIQFNRNRIQRPLLARAAFNVICNGVVVSSELLRIAVANTFGEHGASSIVRDWPGWQPVSFIPVAATTLFTVYLPIRIWSSFLTEKQLEAQRIRLTEARLAALTNQINPHFLFNTLNSVSTLIRINPDKARSVVYKLSNILRKLLRQTDAFTPLRDEIAFIDDYLAIEIVRFGDKLRFSKEIEEAALGRLVPSMLLQPIVENSIKHGLSSKVEGGSIHLRAWIEGSRLHIEIADDGVGISETRLLTLFELGIGVSNVNERLKVLFGTNYRMLVDSEPGQGTQTTIVIPEVEAQVAALASQAS